MPAPRNALALVVVLGTDVAYGATSTAQRATPERSSTAVAGRSSAGYYRWLGGIAFGRGVRFNNPYRLRTVLGDDAESLSLTAPYLDGWGLFAMGRPNGWQHGPALHVSIALEGVSQEVLAPSYALLTNLGQRWLVFGRAGVPVIVEPDANVGFEGAVGAILHVTAAWALTAELVGDLFYGAATAESSRTPIPLVSLQFGAAVDYEVLP